MTALCRFALTGSVNLASRDTVLMMSMVVMMTMMTRSMRMRRMTKMQIMIAMTTTVRMRKCDEDGEDVIEENSPGFPF